MDALELDLLGLSVRGAQDRTWAATTRPDVQFVDLPSATVRLRVAGSGAHTVVLCADPPNVIEHYDTVIDLLTPWARVVCYEAPGFGFSTPKAGFTFTLADYSTTLAQLLDTLGWVPYVLAMPCVAVYPALRVAAAHPRVVSHLLMMQAPAWPEEMAWVKRIDVTGTLRTPFAGQMYMARRSQRVCEQWYPLALSNPAQTPIYLQPSLDALAHGAGYCLASFFQQWFGQAEPDFPPVPQPTLVLWGTEDKPHQPTDRQSILRYVPHAQVIEWPDAGHFPELEQSHRFNAALQHLLSIREE